MNISNKLCTPLHNLTNVRSLQFDPAPREGEPQVSRRTPGPLPTISPYLQ